MPPDPFARLATDLEFRAVEEHTSPPVPAPLAVSPLQARLLRLAADRLREGLTPPHSYYWWNNDEEPIRLGTRAI